MGNFIYNEIAVRNMEIEDTTILDRLIDASSARQAHQRKNHAKIDKRMTLSEAVSEYVKDGDIWCDSSFCYVRSSLQAFFEVIRQGKKNLQAIGAPNTNQSYGILYGTTPYSHMSYTGAEMRGFDRNFSRQVKNKKTKILSDWSHGSMALGFKAAQLGVCGLFAKNLLGSDILNHNPYVRLMTNPVKNENDPCVFIPALYPDVVFIHVHAADKYGNARFYGPSVNDVAVAAAARKVIITAEEIVPNLDIRYNNKGVMIPYMFVDAVVELPYGAAPGQMPGCYYWSRQWWEKMMRYAALSDENMREFFDEWIIGTKNQYEFIDKLGGSRWLSDSRRLTKAAEFDNEDDGVDFKYEAWHPGILKEIWN